MKLQLNEFAEEGLVKDKNALRRFRSVHNSIRVNILAQLKLIDYLLCLALCVAHKWVHITDLFEGRYEVFMFKIDLLKENARAEFLYGRLNGFFSHQFVLVGQSRHGLFQKVHFAFENLHQIFLSRTRHIF